jgi:hypothetical protein
MGQHCFILPLMASRLFRLTLCFYVVLLLDLLFGKQKNKKLMDPEIVAIVIWGPLPSMQLHNMVQGPCILKRDKCHILRQFMTCKIAIFDLSSTIATWFLGSSWQNGACTSNGWVNPETSMRMRQCSNGWREMKDGGLASHEYNTKWLLSETTRLGSWKYGCLQYLQWLDFDSESET